MSPSSVKSSKKAIVKQNIPSYEMSLRLAFDHLSKGNPKLALPLLEKVISQSPNQPQALILQGEAQAGLGNHMAAIDSFLKAISLEPRTPGLYYNLSNSYKALRRNEEAEEALRKELVHNPKFAAAHFNLGNLLREEGRYEEAVNEFTIALSDLEGYAPIHHLLADCFSSIGKTDEALTHRLQSADLAPNDPYLQKQCVAALHDAGKLDEALLRANSIIKLWPSDPEGYALQGTTLLELNRAQESVSSLRTACRLNPGWAEVRYQLGLALHKLGEADSAIEAVKAATQLKPEYMQAYLSLGDLCRMSDRRQEAISAYSRAIECDRSSYESVVNRALEYHSDLKFQLAELDYRRGIEIEPHRAEAHLNLGQMLLLQGRFEEGWKENAWRLRREGNNSFNFEADTWNGEELKDNELLVWGEQGLGDQIQFLRYLMSNPLSQTQLQLQCSPGLQQLFRKNLPDNIEICERANGEPWRGRKFSKHVSLMSLPGVFQTVESTIPAKEGYLKADSNLAEQWVKTLGEARGLRVAVAWSGNPAHKSDRFRSCTLEDFAPFAKLKDVEWFSMQCGAAAGQLAFAPRDLQIKDISSRLTDFAETAAALESMDLVLCVDTSLAHLAGAMGKAVWVMLPPVPDWRWMLKRTDSPWYASMRLFRRTSPLDWSTQIEDVCSALDELIAKSM